MREHWIHKRCFGIRGRLTENYICSNCANPSEVALPVKIVVDGDNGNSVKIFCYLGDTIGDGHNFLGPVGKLMYS